MLFLAFPTNEGVFGKGTPECELADTVFSYCMFMLLSFTTMMIYENSQTKAEEAITWISSFFAIPIFYTMFISGVDIWHPNFHALLVDTATHLLLAAVLVTVFARLLPVGVLKQLFAATIFISFVNWGIFIVFTALNPTKAQFMFGPAGIMWLFDVICTSLVWIIFSGHSNRIAFYGGGENMGFFVRCFGYDVFGSIFLAMNLPDIATKRLGNYSPNRIMLSFCWILGTSFLCHWMSAFVEWGIKTSSIKALMMTTFDSTLSTATTVSVLNYYVIAIIAMTYYVKQRKIDWKVALPICCLLSMVFSLHIGAGTIICFALLEFNY